MQFLADENCDALIVRTLREAGYNVTYVAEFSRSATDPMVLEQSKRDQRILITEDLDFGELVFRDQLEAYGILLLRLGNEKRDAKQARILDVVKTYEQQLVAMFTVVAEKEVRQRPLPTI